MTVQYLSQALQHVVRCNVGKKAEPAPVDTEQGYVVFPGEPRGIEHGSVATNCDNQIRNSGDFGFRQPPACKTGRRLRHGNDIDLSFC